MTTQLKIRYVTYEHPTEGLLVRTRLCFEGGPEVDQGWRRCVDDDHKPCEAEDALRAWWTSDVELVNDGTAPEPHLVVDVSAPLSDTDGNIMDDGISITWGGACPVQGDGSVDGVHMYYRARGSGWSVEIGDDFEYAESRYIWPDGGWLDATVSESNIRKAVDRWRARKEKA